MREVVVISTQTNGLNRIKTDAKTWGELQTVLTDKGVQISNMKATVRGRTESLSNASDSLPDEDFHLFLSPNKVKSGK